MKNENKTERTMIFRFEGDDPLKPLSEMTLPEVYEVLEGMRRALMSHWSSFHEPLVNANLQELNITVVEDSPCKEIVPLANRPTADRILMTLDGWAGNAGSIQEIHAALSQDTPNLSKAYVNITIEKMEGLRLVNEYSGKTGSVYRLSHAGLHRIEKIKNENKLEVTLPLKLSLGDRALIAMESDPDKIVFTFNEIYDRVHQGSNLVSKTQLEKWLEKSPNLVEVVRVDPYRANWRYELTPAGKRRALKVGAAAVNKSIKVGDT